MNADNAAFEEALERSSLGTQGARSLRRQTPPDQVARVRRLARLRDTVVSGRSDAKTCTELFVFYTELGYEADLIPVWRFLSANPQRFSYLPQLVNDLPTEIVVRLLDASDLAVVERLLSSMADERLVEILSRIDRGRALTCVRQSSAAGSIQLIRALVAYAPAEELADWLMATPPTMAAGAVIEHCESRTTLVARLLQNLDVAHAHAILDFTSPGRAADYLERMRGPSQLISQLPYRLCLKLLHGTFGAGLYRSVSDALARRVAREISTMPDKTAATEMRRIERESVPVANYIRAVMTTPRNDNY